MDGFKAKSELKLIEAFFFLKKILDCSEDGGQTKWFKDPS